MVRANFTAALETYQNCGRKLAQETLHAIFFVPRGADNNVIHIDIEARIDDVNQMLGLQQGQALIDSTHPLHRDNPPPVGGGPLRFFPAPGKGGTTIARPLPQSETHHFLEALGKSVPGVLDPNFAVCCNTDKLFDDQDGYTSGDCPAMIFVPLRTTPRPTNPPFSTSSSQRFTT